MNTHAHTVSTSLNTHTHTYTHNIYIYICTHVHFMIYIYTGLDNQSNDTEACQFISNARKVIIIRVAMCCGATRGTCLVVNAIPNDTIGYLSGNGGTHSKEDAQIPCFHQKDRHWATLGVVRKIGNALGPKEWLTWARMLGSLRAVRKGVHYLNGVASISVETGRRSA